LKLVELYRLQPSSDSLLCYLQIVVVEIFLCNFTDIFEVGRIVQTATLF
jgi:hypothetical protein